MAKCPICGEELIVEPTTCVGGCIGEAYERCPKEHYYYGYAYGSTQYIIGEKVFGWYHSDSKEVKGEVREKINEAIKEGVIINERTD